MKSRDLMLVVLVLVLAVCMAYNVSLARENQRFEPAKIAVVSMRRVFENNKKNLEWNKKMDEKREQYLGELRALKKQIDADRADMETRKKDSADYKELRKVAFEKQSTLDARQKYYEQVLLEEEKNWTEQLYQEILGVVKKVAKDKGVDVVLAKEEFNFPADNTNELLLTIKTSKVLYADETLEITDDVLAAVDGAYFNQ